MKIKGNIKLSRIKDEHAETGRNTKKMKLKEIWRNKREEDK